jgi:hypothetical protein
MGSSKLLTLMNQVAVEKVDDFAIIAAMAAAILSCKFCGDFMVRQHLYWDSHTKSLIEEGIFSKIY